MGNYKVVWCRLGFRPHFAVVSSVDDPDRGVKPVVPGDHCVFVAASSAATAHYLCTLLNSTPYQRCLRDVAPDGKSSLSKSVVSKLRLPAWRGTETQRRLADLSRRAHERVADRPPDRAGNAASIRGWLPSGRNSTAPSSGD